MVAGSLEGFFGEEPLVDGSGGVSVVLPGPTALPRCFFPTPHSQALPACPGVQVAGSLGQSWFWLPETFLWQLCIPFLPPMEPGSGRFPPNPCTFLALEQHELSGFPAPRFQLGSGIELSHTNFHLALTKEEAVPEPRADPAAQPGLGRNPWDFTFVPAGNLDVCVPVQGPGETSGAGRTGRAARSHLPGINRLKPAALLLP